MQVGNQTMKIDFLGNHLSILPELAQLHFDEWRHFSPDKTLEDRVLKRQGVAQSSEIPWLASVFVKSEFRNNGIASSLVRHIEGEARKRGIEKLYLYTEHARELYLRLGWHDIEQCEYQGVNVAIMYKQVVT